uniref:Uncharacterized protein n=1 Tax=Cannabis sativa TaxID=3483 RepID=A0A803P6E0_CANSA
MRPTSNSIPTDVDELIDANEHNDDPIELPRITELVDALENNFHIMVEISLIRDDSEAPTGFLILIACSIGACSVEGAFFIFLLSLSYSEYS